MILIGISGKKKSGKNTAADMMIAALLEKYPKDSIIIQLAFASELKKEIATALGVTVHHIETYKDVFRLVLQGWGEMRRRLYGEDYWVNKLLEKITQTPPNTKAIIITDVRHINEANIIQNIGGYSIRLNRGLCNAVEDSHPSEIALDHYDNWYATLTNDASLEALRKQVYTLIDKIHKEQ